MLLAHTTQVLDEIARRGRIRRPLVWIVQSAIFLASGITAFLLRFDFSVPPQEATHLLLALPVWMIVKTAVFRRAKLDSGWWGFISLFDLARFGAASVTGSMLSAIPIFMVAGSSFPRSIYVLDMLLCFLATTGVRVVVRMLMEHGHSASGDPAAPRTVIYGAGQAGVMLARELRSASPRLHTVCGFVDDDPGKKGDSLHGVPVWGSGASLAAVVAKYGIQEILIAIPTAVGPQMIEILKHCHRAAVPYKMVPSLGEIMHGQGLAQQIRNVDVEDLLGRTPVNLDENQISGRIRGGVVLVTGAGGSIGSELCRQLARFTPAAIVGYDTSENALFYLDAEMRERWREIPFHPEIGSTQNERRVAEVLRKYSPSMVFHAAAYKHVPLLESHMFEAVENNILATATMARLAAQYGVDEFVMISTDKAVRPTSLLGATKRVAEMVVNSSGGGATKYASVRFGNVLGSNGSVVPTFKKQIAAGGPVTVTHPDVHRYFMTIPEAARLVLQASAMGRGGEVFVLDMGQPVKIADLARNLILLSGLRPDEDVKIVFTGLRPGEKLYEELNTCDEFTQPTAHEKIKIFRGAEVSRDRMARHLAELAVLCEERDASNLILALKDIVPEYNPSTHVLRQAMRPNLEPDAASLAALANKIGFTSQIAPATGRLVTDAAQ
jgi:FlaA1/EpsC-like NDP-sugar epimerase